MPNSPQQPTIASPHTPAAQPSTDTKDWDGRVAVTVLYWLFAGLVGLLIDNGSISVPGLNEKIVSLFQEQASLPMLLFNLTALAFVALLGNLLAGHRLQSEIRTEAVRLWYTIGAAGGALTLVTRHWSNALIFYSAAVLLPWCILRFKPFG